MRPRLRRSLLYVPASNSRALEKARSLPCDVVILDFEDAVAPGAKAEARRTAVTAIEEGAFGEREVVVRINGLATPWAADDLAAVRQVRPHAVLAPKISHGPDVADYAAALGETTALWAMIETCGAVLRLNAIAGVQGLAALVFGSNDLLAEMGAAVTPDRAPLQAALGLTVMAARAHGLAVFDGVFNDLSDPDGFAAECAQGAAFGFDGKTLIHPSQIGPCHASFAPTPAMVARARAIVEAFEQQGPEGVLLVGGRMVERLHLDEARRVLAIHEAASGSYPA
jgi:citrate lyase subunit beta/citryl-CoA lyase